MKLSFRISAAFLALMFSTVAIAGPLREDKDGAYAGEQELLIENHIRYLEGVQTQIEAKPTEGVVADAMVRRARQVKDESIARIKALSQTVLPADREAAVIAKADAVSKALDDLFVVEGMLRQTSSTPSNPKITSQRFALMEELYRVAIERVEDLALQMHDVGRNVRLVKYPNAFALSTMGAIIGAFGAMFSLLVSMARHPELATQPISNLPWDATTKAFASFFPIMLISVPIFVAMLGRSGKLFKNSSASLLTELAKIQTTIFGKDILKLFDVHRMLLERVVQIEMGELPCELNLTPPPPLSN